MTKRRTKLKKCEHPVDSRVVFYNKKADGQGFTKCMICGKVRRRILRARWHDVKPEKKS